MATIPLLPGLCPVPPGALTLPTSNCADELVLVSNILSTATRCAVSPVLRSPRLCEITHAAVISSCALWVTFLRLRTGLS